MLAETPVVTEQFVRSLTSEIPEVDGDGNTVIVRLIPWNDPRKVYDRGRSYVESFARGGLKVAPELPLPLYVENEHDGPVIGVLDEVEDRDDGLYGTVRLSRSTRGTDALEDIRARILRYVSVDFYDTPVPAGAERVERSSAFLRRVAFTLTPQHDAPVVSVRSHPTPTQPETENPEMTTETIPAEQLDEQTGDEQTAETEVSQRSAPTIRRAPVLPVAHPERFSSLGHFARSAALGQITDAELQRYQRALADLTTAELTGLQQEQWIAEVIDIGRTYAPTVANWRSRPLPTEGMSISQPVVTTRPTTAKQTAEKAEIESTAAVIGIAQWDIETYAGGNDVSIQALTRSTPDLLTELMRLYMRELAHDLNAAAVTSLNAAAAVGVSGNAALEYVDAETFDELVIDASAAFMRPTALRRPAELMALSVDLWAALGKAKDGDGRPLYPSLNPMNAAGTFSATSADGNVMSVRWYVEPDLGAGIKGVIGVADAFVSARGPVGTLTVDVPSKIGRDVAVYQEAAFGAAEASGLVQIVNLV